MSENFGLITKTFLDAGCNVSLVQDKHQLDLDFLNRSYTLRISLPHGHNTLAINSIISTEILQCDMKTNIILCSMLQDLRAKASKGSVINRLTQAISQCSQ